MYSHSTEQKAVLITLVVGDQIVIVEHTNLKHSSIRADTEVGDDNYRNYLDNKLMVK